MRITDYKDYMGIKARGISFYVSCELTEHTIPDAESLSIQVHLIPRTDVVGLRVVQTKT